MTRQRGFTLVEAIIAMVITGIVAGIVAVFMMVPIRGYFDSVRRAGMTDVADTALRRLGFELRAAVPNSVRVTAVGGDFFLEFVPAQDGGRYRRERGAVGEDPLDSSVAGDTAFNVIGPGVTGAAGDFLVIFNTGQAGLSAYEGCTLPNPLPNTNCRTLTPGTQVSFANTGFYPPFDSPSQRFHIVPATGPVTFACQGPGLAGGNGTGTLRRFTGYGFAQAQPTPPAGAGALLANSLSACSFTYAPVNATNGLVTLQLTITRENESVTLVHQIHVDNAP